MQLRPKHRFGWKEEDQEYEDLIPLYPFPDLDPDTTDTYSTSSTETVSPDNVDESSDIAGTSEEELDWDTSPCQIALSSTFQPNHDAPPPRPLMSTPVQPPPLYAERLQKKSRQRINATTRPHLSRQHAFRSPRHNQAFISTPPLVPRLPFQTIPEVRAPPSFRTRVFTPTSPTQVRMNHVNDLSALPVPQEATRRSSRNVPRIDYRETPPSPPRRRSILSDKKEKEDRPRKC